MSGLPILDGARLRLISRGDSAIEREFLDALIEEAAMLVAQLAGLAGDDDRRAVAEIAHRIKGMATELGAARLRQAAAALEAAPLPQQWPAHTAALTVALDELRGVRLEGEGGDLA